jgi:hypothetical protein
MSFAFERKCNKTRATGFLKNFYQQRGYGPEAARVCIDSEDLRSYTIRDLRNPTSSSAWQYLWDFPWTHAQTRSHPARQPSGRARASCRDKVIPRQEHHPRATVLCFTERLHRILSGRIQKRDFEELTQANQNSHSSGARLARPMKSQAQGQPLDYHAQAFDSNSHNSPAAYVGSFAAKKRRSCPISLRPIVSECIRTTFRQGIALILCFSSGHTAPMVKK